MWEVRSLKAQLSLAMRVGTEKALHYVLSILHKHINRSIDTYDQIESNCVCLYVCLYVGVLRGAETDQQDNTDPHHTC